MARAIRASASSALIVHSEKGFDSRKLDEGRMAHPGEHQAAAREPEYLGRFRDDVGGWADLALIEAAVDRGVTVRPPRRVMRPAIGGMPFFLRAAIHSQLSRS